MTRNPSLFDVARHCGVSHQTVSRVVNGNPNVSAATRQKVLAAIEELGYQRNLAARALATGRTQTIGVLTFDSTLYGPTAMLHAIQVAARHHGYRVVLGAVSDISNQAITDGLSDLEGSNVDGIVVISPRSSNVVPPLRMPVRVPVVFREVQDAEGFAVVDVDQRSSAKAAVRHLIGLGHRKIAHISGPLGWLTAQRRREGWLQALAEGALGSCAEAAGDWSPESGYEAARVLLNSQADFTAVFVANDAMALGALKAFREAGWEVPASVSVVGFDATAEGKFFVPALTSMGQDFDAVGEQLLAALIGLIESPETAPNQVYTGSEIVLGASAASTKL